VRVVFLGSGAFAIPSFEVLSGAGHEVAAVVTQPDREKGRGRALTPPPLKPVAVAHRVPVLQPRRIREPEAQIALRQLRADLLVVVAYGQILPQAVLDLAPRGAVNVHASLLPLYRGAAPIQWAIVRGETETGVTTMLLDQGLDTGPILLSQSTPIGPEETASALEPRLARLGASLLLDTLAGLEAGSLHPTPQDHARATLAPILRKEDGRIDWVQPAAEVACRVRGFDPWPGTWTTFAGRVLKVIEAVALPVEAVGEPGQVMEARPDGLRVACGGGTCLAVRRVQPESRRPMDAAAFAAGAHLAPGTRFI
jgi:methionyl-tRNA formyltransferase